MKFAALTLIAATIVVARPLPPGDTDRSYAGPQAPHTIADPRVETAEQVGWIIFGVAAIGSLINPFS